jgi:hypothetical protein
MGWLVGVVAVVALLGFYLTWTAKRVDRLHARAASAGRALDAQLVRRAATSAVLAEEHGEPDLYAAARAALDAREEDREAAENDLTRVLRRQELDSQEASDLAVIAASRRVALARQVHTDFVRDALAVRSRPLVRALRMTRRHQAPAYFDIGDPTLASVTQVTSRATRD